jgi:hypothetical protein
MADRTVLSPLTDIEWLTCLGGNLWHYGRYHRSVTWNGYRIPRKRITRPELERIKRIVREHDLPCEALRTAYGTELAIYVVERGGTREVMRLTHRHIPSHSYDPSFRRRVAVRMFTTFVEELHRHRNPEHPPTT